MKIKKILWPTDLSENSEKALPMVSSLAAAYGAEIHVLYVLEEIGSFGAWYGDFDRTQLESLSKAVLERAQRHLQEICEKSLGGCPYFIRHTASGDPASEILKAIDDMRPDIVVISRKGKTGSFEAGAVAEKIIRHSKVPVLAVPV